MPAFALPDRAAPSYGNRFATDASQSAYPNLWKGLLVGLSPSLGFNGTSLLRTYGMRKGDATLVAMESDNLSVIKGKRCLRTQTTGGTKGEYFTKSLVFSAYPVSASCWFYSESVSASAVFSLNQQDDAYLAVFHHLTANKLSLATRASGTSLENATTANLELNKWHHVVAVWESSVKRSMYLNGVLVVSSTTSCSCPSVTRLLGGGLRDVSLSTLNLNGYLSTTLVYNRVLLHDEIQTLYTDHMAPFRVRHRFSFPEQVEAGGVSVPKFMHHYKVRRTA